MKGLMSVLAKEPNEGDTDDLGAAPELEGGPTGMPSEQQIAVAGDVMSAMQNRDTDGFAEALASFVEMSK